MIRTSPIPGCAWRPRSDHAGLRGSGVAATRGSLVLGGAMPWRQLDHRQHPSLDHRADAPADVQLGRSATAGEGEQLGAGAPRPGHEPRRPARRGARGRGGRGPGASARAAPARRSRDPSSSASTRPSSSSVSSRRRTAVRRMFASAAGWIARTGRQEARAHAPALRSGRSRCWGPRTSSGHGPGSRPRSARA